MGVTMASYFYHALFKWVFACAWNHSMMSSYLHQRMHIEPSEKLTIWLVSPWNRPRNRPRLDRFGFIFYRFYTDRSRKIDRLFPWKNENRPRPFPFLVHNIAYRNCSSFFFSRSSGMQGTHKGAYTWYLVGYSMEKMKSGVVRVWFQYITRKSFLNNHIPIPNPWPACCCKRCPSKKTEK